MTHNLFSQCLRATALAMAGAVCLSAMPAAAQSQTARTNLSGDFIVAVVNTEAVTSVEVAQRIERLGAEVRRGGGKPPDADALRHAAAEAGYDLGRVPL